MGVGSIDLNGDTGWWVDFGSLTIEQRIGERSTASVVLWDELGSRGGDGVLEGMPITILDPSGGTAFDGFVQLPEGERPNPDDTPFRWQVAATDFHYLADKRVVADAWVNTAVNTIVTEIITNVLSEEGVTAGTIDTGLVLAEVVLNYVTCSRAFDRLAAIAHMTWWIDDAKALHFVHVTGSPAKTVDVDDCKHSPLLRRANPDYRNREVIRGARGYTDPQTEDFIGDGTLQSFVTAYTVGRVPTITLNSGAQTVGIRGLDTGKDWYWQKGSPVISQEGADTPIGSGDDLRVVYEGLFEMVAIVDDEAEQVRLAALEGSGSGKVEHVQQVTDVFSREAAFDVGGGLLNTYAQEGKTITFVTARDDYVAGQYVTVNLPELGEDGEAYLCAAVASRDLSRPEWEYSVTLVQGPAEGSWQRRLAQGLIDADVLVLRENVSEEETITILQSVSEGWTWAETSVTQAVAACPIPATTLHPSTSLLPC